MASKRASACQLHVRSCAGAKLAGLMEEFEEFDEGLVRTLLEDQAGDVLEVRVYLGVSSHWQLMVPPWLQCATSLGQQTTDW